jgi:hypothetical protein
MLGAKLEYFGIRHHGPGSARQLAVALETLRPQALLIELPADCQELLGPFDPHQLEPPVAILQYDKRDFNNASSSPMANFSPEWIALVYAFENKIPVHPIDLPNQILLCQENFSNRSSAARSKDPFSLFAQSLGQSDTEAWWESFFEIESEREDHFEVVKELIAHLREGTEESEETLAREAFMRISLKEYSKKYNSLAVVCGAWHLPALQNHQDYKVKEDLQRLKNLKKITLESVWIPWSYQRLKASSGYKAGVVFPAWYEWLFTERHKAGARWLVQVNRFLREKTNAPLGAVATEAFALAQQLTSMRKKSLPGFEELFDAQVAVSGMERNELSKWLDQRFLTGDKVGKVGSIFHRLPLQSDFDARVKSARLTKDWEQGYTECKELDLRKPSHLKASELLHSLILLNVPWGKWLNPEGSGLGNFREQWELHWLPDYYLTLLECGLWGNTLEEALRNKTINALDPFASANWSRLLHHIFRCGIPELSVELFALLSKKLVEEEDLEPWLELFPKLLHYLRFGDLRNTSTEVLEQLLLQIFNKVQFTGRKFFLNKEENHLHQRIHVFLEFHQSLQLWSNAPAPSVQAWQKRLLTFASQPECPPEMKGTLTYLSWNCQLLDPQTLAIFFHREVNDVLKAENGSRWLYGFFVGQPGILLLNPLLFAWVSQWIKGLEEEVFNTVVPPLRKVFGSLSSTDKQALLSLTLQLPVQEQQEPPPPSREIWEIVEKNISQLLGEQ